MIEFDRVSKTYGEGAGQVRALQDVSFSVAAGEYVAIMGASGTGKSTLMHLLGGLDTPSAGVYRLDGVDVAGLNDDGLSALRNRKIGFVFQQFHLLERTTALQNVLLPLIYADDYPADAEARGRRVLEAVGLGDRMDHRPNELSGGQQQRVAVARALINDPALLLADEPTGNLDRQSGLQLLSVFKRLHQQGRTIIVVTHDEQVAEHADRIRVLRDGRIADDRRVPEPRDADAGLETLAASEGAAGAQQPEAEVVP
ncbi:MAG: ABC transporter ATP-binding protein [Gemmatimonadetes bacterium]|nr:ABC transporter ATP-binding protein [Gemmatimonadota bacterium]